MIFSFGQAFYMWAPGSGDWTTTPYVIGDK